MSELHRYLSVIVVFMMFVWALQMMSATTAGVDDAPVPSDAQRMLLLFADPFRKDMPQSLVSGASMCA